MAVLTIRSLDDEVMEGLRVRAARHGRSMEAEAHAILREALRHGPVDKENFAVWVRRRFKGLEVEMPIPPRSRSRRPPS